MRMNHLTMTNCRAGVAAAAQPVITNTTTEFQWLWSIISPSFPSIQRPTCPQRPSLVTAVTQVCLDVKRYGISGSAGHFSPPLLLASFAEILFDFRIDVRQSCIPNSGNGAFLTFLGARRLRDDCERVKPVDDADLEFAQDLVAQLPHHRHCMHVKLCGEIILDGKYQRPLGIGPLHSYEESDFEPSDTTFFSSKSQQQTHLLRKYKA